jgi:hypothetical protein
MRARRARTRYPGRIWRLPVVAALGLCLLADAASAEVRRLEVVGAVPADPDRRGDQPLRKAALEAALAEAVSRVARGLLADPEGQAPDIDLAKVLGEPTDYALRYRVLEERGERRALLVDDPEVTTEFVVLVEVHVDVDRVQARLAEAGLEAVVGTGQSFRIELLEVPSERAYTAVRRALVEQAGAERAIPVELAPGRAVLSVEAPEGSKVAVGRLLAADLGPGISLQSLSPAGQTVRLRLFEVPPEPEPVEEIPRFGDPQPGPRIH